MQNEQENTDASKEIEAQQTPPAPEESKPSFDGQAFYSEGYKNAFNLVDNALNELGFDKPEGAKTTDWLRSVISENKTQKEEPEVKPEADYSEYESKLKELESERNKFAEMLEKYKAKEYDNEINEAIDTSNIIIPNGLDDNGKTAFRNAIRNQISGELKKVFKKKDGKIIAVNSEGIPLLNPNTGIPYTPKEYAESKFQTFFKQVKATKDVSIKEIKTEGLNISMDAIPSNKRQVTELLIKNGMPANSSEHRSAFYKIVEKYNITKL